MLVTRNRETAGAFLLVSDCYLKLLRPGTDRGTAISLHGFFPTMASGTTRLGLDTCNIDRLLESDNFQSHPANAKFTRWLDMPCSTH